MKQLAFLLVALASIDGRASAGFLRRSRIASKLNFRAMSPITAGWCMNQDCERLPKGLDQVNAGSFGKTTLHQGPMTLAGTPLPPPAGIPRRFVTFGGQGVHSGAGESDTITVAEIQKAVSDFSATGVDFDLEGGLATGWGQTLANAVEARKESSGRGLQIQLTVMGSANVTSKEGVVLPGAQDIPWLEANGDKYDYVALMLYADAMSGSGWEIPECYCGKAMNVNNPGGSTYRSLEVWLKSNISKEKIVLGMTTDGLEQHMIEFYQQLVDKYGLAGISFWKAHNFPESLKMPSYGSPPPTPTKECPAPPPPVKCPAGKKLGSWVVGGKCACYDKTAPGLLECQNQCPQ